MRTTTIVSLLAYLSTASVVSYGQASGGDARVRIHQPASPKENNWRANPVPLTPATEDSNPPLRAARNAYWDAIYPPIEHPERRVWSNGSGIVANHDNNGEFTSANLQRAFIVAKFVSYHVYQTPSKGGMYTEMTFTVTEAFRGGPSSAFSPGQSIILALGGGKAYDQDGAVIDLNNKTNQILPEPGHTYLMDLIPCGNSNCKALGYYLLGGRKWDLTSGTAIPKDPFDIFMYKAGLSVISGTPSETVPLRFAEVLSRFTVKTEPQ